LLHIARLVTTALAPIGGPNMAKNVFARFASAKILQKNKRRKGLSLCALISHKLMSEGMNELKNYRINELTNE